MFFTTEFLLALALALVFASGHGALAVNDWSVPCIQGHCSWDLPLNSSSSGSVLIRGPSSTISDITPAAGWNITSGCNPTSSNQEIQLTCKNNNSDCAHLFQGGGAVDTIVRLPDRCGPMPFARVARHQIIQSNSSFRAIAPPVHQLTLDTNFSAVTPSQDGNVEFSIQGTKGNGNAGSSSPNPRGHRSILPHVNSRDEIYRRNVFAHGLNAPRHLAHHLGTFNETLPLKPIPIDFSGVKNLLNTSTGNSASTSKSISTSVSLDVGADVHVSISLGAVAEGTLIPPSINEFGLYFVLDGIVVSNLSVMANNAGQVNSGSITLFQLEIPGLSIPGLLELSPEFKLMGQIDANFGQDSVNAVVDLNYNLTGLSFIFPPQGSESNGFTPDAKHGNVTISANPDTCAPFNATSHLIPEVDIGLSALGGTVSTSVFLNLDASADFSLYNATTSKQQCVSASTNLNASVSAKGSFFDIFKASAGMSLFDKEFPPFQECSGNSSSMAS